MFNPGMLILYVDNPPASTDFYTALLDRQPIEASATFAMFSLNSGIKLALWSKHTVQPPAAICGGGGEITSIVNDDKEIDNLYKSVYQLRLRIAQAPARLEFGYSFMVLDPDGHRLRFLSLAEKPDLRALSVPATDE